MDTVYVETKNLAAASHLAKTLNQLDITGVLFLGHPVIEKADERIAFDAVLVSLEYGVVGFDFNDEEAKDAEDLEEKQYKMHHILKSLLYSNRSLLYRKELAVPIEIISLTERNYPDAFYEDIKVCSPEDLIENLANFKPMDEKYLSPALAVLQNTTSLKPDRRRPEAKTEGSMGSALKEIEKAITKFDQWQNRAALQTSEGPQRIRGLAGSGKTIILANKAARLHFLHPEWKIAITFNTRTLYQQFSDLIRRFYYLLANEEPNWDNIHIRHAWGGAGKAGIYSDTAKREGVSIRNYSYAKSKFGQNKALEGICEELLYEVGDSFQEIYDIILIDEAQDLPKSFFELTHQITSSPKRIVWAYDELQNLVDYTMLPPSELFGTTIDGIPRVEIASNQLNGAQDMILPVCYRNTPWALTIAHGLGFGTGRIGGLVQFFEDTSLWDAIGYEVLEGSLELGERVKLKRRPDAYPPTFMENLFPQDAVKTIVFDSEDAQAEWVAQSIIKNLSEDELQIEDIMVIVADAGKIASSGSKIKHYLLIGGINSHTPGYGDSNDEFFKDNSVVISTIHRAKGNESAMVYLVNSEYGISKFDLIRRRNTLFTGITRSKAWVRISGIGEDMTSLKKEIDIIVESEYTLDFNVPNSLELDSMKKIHRDRSADEIRKMENIVKTTEEFIDRVHSGDISIETLSQQDRARLRDMLDK